MKNNRRYATRLSLTACVLLIANNIAFAENIDTFRDMAVVCAAEDGRTYEEYRSGQGAGLPDRESGYTELHISTEEELAALAADCALDSWSRDKYVVLDGDIVLSGNSEIVIPSFGGVFEGGGHKISNLRIETAGSAQGLFRYIQEGAEVRSLSVSGRVQPGGSQNRVGILAGVNYGRIIDCSTAGSVAGDGSAGGVVGVNEASGEIRRCSSAAAVSGAHETGGICGRNSGVLNNCSNSGGINTYSKDITYDLEDITLENLESLNSMSNVKAHTDTGGIAGYSEGKIYYCSNTGTVGYQHVGYNTGGIVGRLHQGYIQNCTNHGRIYGRKDVGGIVGQMEPFLEIRYLNDKLQEIDREADRLISLLDRANEDIQRYGEETSQLAKDVTAHLNNVSAAAGNLMGTANYLWYFYNQELAGINTDLQRLNADLKEQGETGGMKDYTLDLGGSVSGGDLGEITVKVPDNTEGYLAALRRFGESATGHIGNITGVTTETGGGITENLGTLDRELRSAADSLERLTHVFGEGAELAGDDMDAISAQAKVLRRSINELRDDLFRYEGIAVADASDEKAGNDSGDPGAEPAEGADPAEGTDGSNGDSNNSDPAEISGSGSGTVAYYDTGSFQQGKITLCVNEGKVEADTNVGGIVGQIATEVDFDPEDDIALSGEESFNIEQTIKAVVRESRNDGEILGKKDYVGGIVGKADFGAVISCESYGRVSSSDGSYVGGIAGASDYAVRSSYFLGELSGRNYVGGIAGRGCDIFYSYACSDLEVTGECGGSVAGGLTADGILAENYYVEGNTPGVDAVGYEGGAMPVPYDVFCNMEGMPEAFRQFTIRFVADGKELAAVTCRYDETPDMSQISTAPPEKEGFYGVWPEVDLEDIRGSMVLEAQYIPWVTTLASRETGDGGKALVLVQGQFLPGAEISVEETAEGMKLSVRDGDGKGTAAEIFEGSVTVRALCEDTENMTVELYEGGTYRSAESAAIGSYLEFQMDSSGTFRLTAAQDDSLQRIAIIAAVVVVALVVIVVAVKVVGKRRKRKGSGKNTGKQEAGK